MDINHFKRVNDNFGHLIGDEVLLLMARLMRARRCGRSCRAFDRVDKAVYYAKAHGRNQVVSYQSLVASGELVEKAEVDQEIDFF